MSAARFLDVARSQLGTIERPTNRTKYGEWYGLDGNAWCDMFASWCAAQAGVGDAVGRFAYTPSHANWFRARGQFGLDPRPGDLVFFQWAGVNRICHVGIVESVLPNGHLVTIEGNSQPGNAGDQSNGGGVYRRVRARTFVRGFGHPQFGDLAGTPVVKANPVPADVRPAPLAVDGEWGKATTAALQRALGVSPDGDLGPITTRALQRRLGVSADGVIGPRTRKALQAKLGVAQDGQWGPQTVRALQQALNSERF